MEKYVNIDEPRYDQRTYIGRVKHFAIVTNPLNLLTTGAQLEEAKRVVNLYRARQTPPGVSEDAIWRAKHLYDSAFHPDTGEKMALIGRMSAQVPMNMTITGFMLTFYRTTPAVILWQWVNQSFNAVVNYTNRSGSSPISTKQLWMSYGLATLSATASAIGLNKLVVTLPSLIGRYVPFVAVAVANAINIPFMRSRELKQGIAVATEDGQELGHSKVAARTGIAQVVFSRIVMATPSMMFVPLAMHRLEKGRFVKRFPAMIAPIQVAMCGVMLIFATPFACAIFSQKSSIAVRHLEADLQEKIAKMNKPVDRVYFNKGL